MKMDNPLKVISMITIRITRRSGVSLPNRLRRPSSQYSFTLLISFLIIMHLPFHYADVAVLHYLEMLHGKPLGVVVGAYRVDQVTARDQVALRNVTFADNHLLRVGHYLIGIVVKVACYTVHPDGLVDVPRNYPVVIPLFLHILIVAECAFVHKEQGAVDVAFNRVFIRRKGEKQFMETAYMLFGLDGTVLRQVLRECQHQRFSAVQHIYFLTLLFSKTVRTPQGITSYSRTQTDKNNAEKANLFEGSLNSF